MDTDQTCGDLDSCPYDEENDADDDGFCPPVCGYSTCTDQQLLVVPRVCACARSVGQGDW